MSYSIGMFNCVPAGQVTTKTVSKKNKFLQTDSLSPLFDVVDEFLLSSLVHKFPFLVSLGEVDPSASGESREIDGIEFSVGVKVVKVLVELRNATAKAVKHDVGNPRLFVN